MVNFNLDVSNETLEDLNKYMDLQQKLEELDLSLGRMKDRLDEGTIHESQPFTQVKSLKSIKVVEERRDEILGMMKEVHDRIQESCIPKSIELGDRWISAGRGFYFKLKDGKVLIADGKVQH